jgi:serine/threonine-protein kinase
MTQMRVPMGSYLLQIRSPGRIPVNYPVHIRRLDHWDGVAPGESEPTPIQLPTPDQVGVDEVYVPAGWFSCGADVERGGLPRERVWVDAFVMLRHPVSNGEYLEFLNDLVRRWRENEAQQCLPGAVPGFPRFEPDRSGVWTLARDAEGRPYGVEWPVVSADWRSAVAYAAWRTIREAKSWALPMELQWEKAARGVDGRIYPWGSHFDPTWACMVESQGGRAHPVPIGAYPEDDSPYGVRGLAGNVRDWCRDAYLARGPRVRSDGRMASERTIAGDGPVYRAVRGGCWSVRSEDCRASWRNGQTEDAKLSDVGIRLVRKFEAQPTAVTAVATPAGRTPTDKPQ